MIIDTKKEMYMSDPKDLCSMSTEQLLERLRFLEPQVRSLDVKQKAVKVN